MEASMTAMEASMEETTMEVEGGGEEVDLGYKGICGFVKRQ